MRPLTDGVVHDLPSGEMSNAVPSAPSGRIRHQRIATGSYVDVPWLEPSVVRSWPLMTAISKTSGLVPIWSAVSASEPERIADTSMNAPEAVNGTAAFVQMDC